MEAEIKVGSAVETVARALFRERMNNGGWEPDYIAAAEAKGYWQAHIAEAMVAITALRNPTDAMIAAGVKHCHYPTDAETIFCAMMDEALK